MSHEPLLLIIAFVFGACIGSFLNVVNWRLPRGKNLTGRSECPSCKHALSWVDLFPVFSYLLQRGQCRYCGTKISSRYAIIELVTAVLFAAAAGWLFPIQALDGVLLLKALFVISVCIAVFVIDWEHYLILDAIVLPGAIILLGFNLLATIVSLESLLRWDSFVGSGLLAAIIAGSAFWLLHIFSFGKWMGLGDVKFVIFMGLALGFPNILVGLFLAFLLGTIVSLPLLFSGKKQLSSKLPFGTFLAAATVVAVFWGNSLWQWYLGVIGLR